MAEKRILLVEDDPDVQFMLLHVLQAERYLADGADSAATARARLAAERYDLVIADWRLPDGSGLDVVNEASKQGAKTIVMSGYLFQIPRTTEPGHEFLMKPMRPGELVEAVKRAIGEP